MRTIEFNGVLEKPSSLKEYWLIYDALQPIEWRVNVHVSPALRDDLPFLLTYFERVVIRDNFDDLVGDTDGYPFVANERAQYFFVNSSEQIVSNLKGYHQMGVRGFDEILIPIDELIADFNEIMVLLEKCRCDLLDGIRRIDIIVPDDKFNTDIHVVKRVKNWASHNDIEFNIVTKWDSPENEWYSRPGIEEIVDPDPMPYQEEGLWCPVTADALYHYNGFHLNLQKFPDDEPFYTGTDAAELIHEMLKCKVHYYTQYADQIQNREGNIYYNYFKWVADHVEICEDTPTFIPNFMLRPHSKYYRELFKDGWHDTNMGLVQMDKRVKPLVTINE